MKLMMGIILLLTQGAFSHEKPLEAVNGYGFITAAQIRTAIQETLAANPPEQRPRMVIVSSSINAKTKQESFTVLGYTEQQIMTMVEDEQGLACSAKHLQGDMANRWCHAAVVKTIDRSLQAYGLSPKVAALAGAAFFVPKEFLMDKKASRSDLVAADISVHETDTEKVEVSVFADGAVFISVRHKF